jgi:hypothetical protein
MGQGLGRPCHVIPAKAGIHGEYQPFATMDPGLRRGVGENRASAFATAAVQESVNPAKAGVHRAASAQPRGLD